MMTLSRANVVSSFTSIKGTMINETYETFAHWDLSTTKKENLRRLRETNYIGATSNTWLRDVAKVLNRRFDPTGKDISLIRLAQKQCDLEIWKPILLWHMTRDEFLFRDFLINWLFPAYEAGSYRVRADELHTYLENIGNSGGVVEHKWTDATLRRVAAGLLKMASDFGLLKGNGVKEFTSYHIPEASFLYVLHAMAEEEKSPRMLIDSSDWRLFLMRSDDVERELLRLHQFRQLDYQVAGSLVQISLPCSSAAEFAERI